MTSRARASLSIRLGSFQRATLPDCSPSLDLKFRICLVGPPHICYSVISRGINAVLLLKLALFWLLLVLL